MLKFFLIFAAIGLFANEGLLQYSKAHLPHSGTLKESNGFVYVDVDDAYVHELIHWIEDEGFEEPPYFGRSDLVGAHISVMTPEEMRALGVDTLEELGASIDFTVKECVAVEPPSWPAVEQVYLLVVEAPTLDQLRAHYGLPSKVFAYHITIGVKQAS